jgi:hypothetical protein
MCVQVVARMLAKKPVAMRVRVRVLDCALVVVIVVVMVVQIGEQRRRE